MGLVFVAGSGYTRGCKLHPLVARGRILLPISAPAGGFCCSYPHPSGRVSAGTRTRGQNCHPYLQAGEHQHPAADLHIEIR
jgi:hypothetical protein